MLLDKMKVIAKRSIAKGVDDMVMEIQCFCCKHPLSVTIEEVRNSSSVYCTNCEIWLPLWEKEGIFQGLHDVAVSVDIAIEASSSQAVP